MKVNKLALKNIVQLSAVQFINYIFPLVTLPYMLRTIGMSNYGLISIALSINVILMALSDYGFSFSATKEISLKEKVDNRLASTIYWYKIMFGLVILLVGAIIISLFTFDLRYYLFFLGFFLFFYSQSMIPNWMFRGLNKMEYISVLTVLSKLMTLCFLVIFINSEEDFYLMGLVYGIPTIISCMLAQYFAHKNGFRLDRVKFSNIVDELKKGKDYFISNAVGILYTSFNVIIVSIIGGSLAAGIYATCERIVGVINSLTNAVSQAVFPIVCKKSEVLQNGKDKLMVSVKYFGWWVLCTSLAAIMIIVLAPYILLFLTGDEASSLQITTLQVMSFVPVLISLGHLFGILTLIPMSFQKQVRNAVFMGAAVNMTLGVTLSYTFSTIGTALAILLCEATVVIREYIVVKKILGRGNYL
ncbi:oligosaccharide flippase family protein [Shouchella clausii]|jgi:polysaccharide transporter, PST family|uniref:oligosaccharide flippase family protein n=1 Tax=Shouchella TaxID=2893057 RepID=UPI0004E74613|nr:MULTISPECIES: oligosaccharide flippase family protein [Shouchella]MCM3311039.1 oligosaccharide flippase family protein [Psychrobacillus sp. MER TA 17]ALA53341.1 Membrane protein involved in the export of O-antigen, teichoic acid lipoteichoic acids [Shouchella clausii]MBU3231133.1 oligosaccharide flippase family protein [Shouchella clausii]MBU3263863.1 oligosaccharide flippase family protein [Shouchella clausii]MBU3508175.1 oligosaccharide flippase family protein [Shouchella clausii]